MATSLPVRPNASQAVPEMVRRWNLMFDDSGARNLTGQRKLHAAMCFPSKDCSTWATIGNVHHSPDFVLWHRAFLYYHEQILSALGGTDLGLPYWDWSAFRLCPPAYVANASTFEFYDNLFRSKLTLGNQDFSSENIVARVAFLRSIAPEDAARELFDEPIHTLPHTKLGWGSANKLELAAGDPLFFGHHGNLDRLATHIFQEGKGWPKPSGNSYHFIGSNGQPVCKTLDAFASMPSTYAGDGPIDTSQYTVLVVDDVGVVKDGGYSQVRVRLQFLRPLPSGLYQVVTGKGTPLGEIASIDHMGTSEFVLWLTPENYRKARAEGIEATTEHVPATILQAVLVTRGE